MYRYTAVGLSILLLMDIWMAQFGAILNKVAVDICIQVVFCEIMLSFCISRTGMTGLALG